MIHFWFCFFGGVGAFDCKNILNQKRGRDGSPQIQTKLPLLITILSEGNISSEFIALRRG